MAESRLTSSISRSRATKLILRVGRLCWSGSDFLAGGPTKCLPLRFDRPLRA